MPKVSVNGFKLYYEIEGDGEPVVLIPGFASGLSLWSRQVPALSRDFRVISFDPRASLRQISLKVHKQSICSLTI